MNMREFRMTGSEVVSFWWRTKVSITFTQAGTGSAKKKEKKKEKKREGLSPFFLQGETLCSKRDLNHV